MDTTAGQEMLVMLPAYYDTDNVRAVLDTQGKEFDTLKTLLLFVMDQIFAASASGWGLDWWEKELDLPTIAGKPDSERRSRIISKLRGMGTVTINLMQVIAEAYDNGLIDVIDHPEDYYFIVQFISHLGAPPNLDDVKSAIEDAKPAHLEVIYEFKYLLIKNIHEVMTLAEMETHPLTDFAPFIPV